MKKIVSICLLISSAFASKYLAPSMLDAVSKYYTSLDLREITYKSDLSSRSYLVNLKGKPTYVRFRCARVNKIACPANYENDIFAYLSAFFLQKYNGSTYVNEKISSYLIIAEDEGSYYNVCIGITGADGVVYLSSYDGEEVGNNNRSYAVLEVIQRCVQK